MIHVELITRIIKSNLRLQCFGVIHIVRTPKGGAEGSSQMRTIAYKGEGRVSRLRRAQKKWFFFWTTKPQNFSFFVQKKLLHCQLLLCIEKCKPVLSYK